MSETIKHLDFITRETYCQSQSSGKNLNQEEANKFKLNIECFVRHIETLLEPTKWDKVDRS